MQSNKLNTLMEKLKNTNDFKKRIALKYEILNHLEKYSLDKAMIFIDDFITELREHDLTTDIDECLLIKASIYRKLDKTKQAKLIYFDLLQRNRYSNLSIKARTYMGFAVLYYKFGNRKKLLKYINKTLEIAENINDKLTYAKALNVKGAFYLTENKNLAAYEVFTKAKREFQKLGELYQVANANVWLASAISEIGDYHRSIEHLTEALTYFEKNEVFTGIADTCNSLGLDCLSINQLEQAKSFFLRALEYYIQHNAKDKLADIESNLGLLYRKAKHFPLAIEHYIKSLEYRSKNSFYKRMYTLSNASSVFIELKDFNNAEKYIEESLKIHKDLNPQKPFISTFNTVLRLAQALGDTDKFHYYEEFISQYDADMTMDNKGVFYGICSEFYESENDYVKTIYYLRKYIDLQDEIRQENKKLYDKLLSNRLEIMKYIANLEKEEKENEKLRELNNDLKKVNNKLVSAQNEIVELERKNSVLAMGITINHEIRQPLMALYGYIEMLDMNIHNKTDSQRRFFQKIYKNKEQIDVLLSKYRENNNYTFDEYVEDVTMINFD